MRHYQNFRPRRIADKSVSRQTAFMSTTSKSFIERTVTVDGQGVSCRFFWPEPDSSSFRCRFEIEWPEGVRSRYAGGADEVQAMLLAMQMAHVDLLAARENDGRDVSWMDGASLGLPIADAIRDWDPKCQF